MPEFTWRPGIGDPTIGGWVTVVLYFLAAWSTYKTYRSILSPKERWLWLLIFVMFIALGINKQLDIQTAFTEIGRIVAAYQGWYDQRQIVQIWFISGVAGLPADRDRSAESRARHFICRMDSPYRHGCSAGFCSDPGGVVSPHRSIQIGRAHV